MIAQFQFYLRHSLNDLRVNRQRTFFSVLCIAAGVAAIVSLQTLAVMIARTLTGGLQESNRGDIQFQADSAFVSDDATLQQGVRDGVLSEVTRSFFGQSANSVEISREGADIIRAWADDAFPGQIDLTYQLAISSPAAAILGGTGAAMTVPETGAQSGGLTPIVIDAAEYPYYGQIVTVDGQPLGDVLTGGRDVVLNTDAARAIEAEVGDIVRIAGSDADFTVRGIVSSDQQIKGVQDAFIAVLGGFYYLDLNAVEAFPDAAPSVDELYVRLADPSRVAEVNRALIERFPYLDTTTTDDLRAQNEQIASSVNQLVTVMGLVSLLIGSIGIVNTMQVIVRRRTLEIAVLKTLGLQADQITALFMIEALIMGVLGSVAGIVLGWLAVFVVRGAAEQLISRDLPFVLAPGAALNGLIVGVLVTAVFGLLPTLSAGQVRPGIVLRPSDDLVPRAGRGRAVLALLVVIAALTLIAERILGSLPVAFGVIVGAFVLAGLMYLALAGLIWLIARFLPSFGSVDLKLSLRQMNAGRRRAAITLLALAIGVFSLSLITLLAESINGLLRFSLEDGSGGNVAITTLSPGQIPLVTAALDEAEGINSYRLLRSYQTSFVALQENSGETVTLDEISQRLATMQSPFGPPEGVEFNQTELFQQLFRSLGARDLTAPAAERALVAGRDLTPADAGQPVVVLTDNQWLSAAGVSVGDKLVLAYGADLNPDELAEAETITLEVVGLYAQSLLGAGPFDSTSSAPLDAFPEGRGPDSIFVVADVEDASVPALRRALADIPGAFVLETALLSQIISALLGTFTAFPTMVAALGLVVGGVVIANSVALTTMERRREIAVMKAVGLQRERVLLMILLENGILGLIGGLIGVGIGLAALVAIVASFSGPGEALPLGTALLLMLLCVGVALLAAASTAWNAAGEKPLNVLRYE